MSLSPSSPLLQSALALIGGHLIRSIPVTGGDINQAWRLETSAGTYFLKTNQHATAGDMFAAEAQGLALLARAGDLRTPMVIGHGTTLEGSFLLLEFIHTSYREEGFWEMFGQSLADLHRSSAVQFGLDHHNFIGTLPQSNVRHDSFPVFYEMERLRPQFELARKAGLLDGEDERRFDAVCRALPSLLPGEPPALIHGDLWCGNFMVGTDNRPVLVDPSVAYSHREMDLAMARLFGGFDRRFYRAYEEAFPLAPGFETRLAALQLYYLLVHVNLFGGGYVGQVRQFLGMY